MNDKKAAKLIIKRAKKHPELYSKEEVKYAKEFRKRLKREKKMRFDGVEERVKAYGWHCDGNDIVGHYVTIENYQLTYNMEGVFTKMVPIRELAHSRA